MDFTFLDDLPTDTIIEITLKGYYYNEETMRQWYSYGPGSLAICVDASTSEDGEYEPMLIDRAAIVDIKVSEPDEPPEGSVALSGDGISFQRIGAFWSAAGVTNVPWENIHRPIKILYVNE
jgi:hypothetical protein